MELNFFENGEDLIASPEVDAVIVATWGPTHEKYAIEAIKHKKYCFVEKPLADKADGCKRIIEAEIEGGKQLIQVGYMRRYDKGYLQLKDALDKKTYGEPLLIHCAHRNPTVPESYTSPMAATDTAVHEFDALRWLLGEDYTSVKVILPKKTRNTHAKLLFFIF